jgi:exodeoxyribonuclease VII small subunit
MTEKLKASVKRLEEIVKLLKEKELDLEESVALLDEGVQLTESCVKSLTLPDLNEDLEKKDDLVEN